jgi:hypothetical protein
LSRKSAASLSVIAPLPGQRRPEPPQELTEAEAAEWRAVVERLPVDWFPRETHPLLVAYCRHVVRARLIAGLINGFDPASVASDEGLRRLDKLAAMAERESKAISSLATRMRISQQSRYHQRTAHTKASDPKAAQPWQRIG